MKSTAGLFLLVLALSRGAAADAPDPTATARRWLLAVRAGDARALEALSALPFRYRELWPGKRCQAHARTAPRLVEVMRCIRAHEPMLLADLEWLEQTLQLEVGFGGAPRPLRRAARARRSAGPWVHGVLPGEGLTFRFLFGLSGEDELTVSAVTVQVEFAGG